MCTISVKQNLHKQSSWSEDVYNLSETKPAETIFLVRRCVQSQWNKTCRNNLLGQKMCTISVKQNLQKQSSWSEDVYNLSETKPAETIFLVRRCVQSQWNKTCRNNLLGQKMCTISVKQNLQKQSSWSEDVYNLSETKPAETIFLVRRCVQSKWNKTCRNNLLGQKMCTI